MTSSAVKILHNRYIGENQLRKVMLQLERDKDWAIREIYKLIEKELVY